MTDTAKTELELLKERADDMGIKYSPNIGVETLRAKVNEKLAPKEEAAPQGANAKRNAIIKEATKLVRVHIQPLNPSKKDSEGEFFRTGNSVVKTISRFVPFNQDTHIEQMLYTQIKSQKYAGVRMVKRNGKEVPEKQLRNAYQIEVLPQLTEQELKDLAAEQAKRQSV